MITHTNNKDDKEVQRISKESIEYAESMRLSKYEPFYAIMDRVIDKAKAFDRIVRK